MSDELVGKAKMPRERLRGLTPARVGLERAGDGVSTREWLDFKLAHAEARDAVHAELQVAALMAELRGLPFGTDKVECLALESEARDRADYLRRPDFGRRLRDASAELLRGKEKGADVVVVIADGLSALAVERHAVGLLREFMPRLVAIQKSFAPVCLVSQGRVAVGDEIGSLLGAKLSIMLIGERPGLSAPDSLGVYLTWAPRVGCTDEVRNCVSNIRAEGLGYVEAADRVAWYAAAAFELGMTGVGLKDGAAKLIGE